MPAGSRIARAIVVVITAACALFSLASCSELEARRTIQKADKLYEDGKYAEAIELYEKALKSSDLDTAHHNLAIAAFVAFQPGISTPSNQKFALQASEHFQAYLESHPDDVEIIELLTTVWVDSDQTASAIAYWDEVRKANPEDPRALRKLSSIHRMDGNYEEALKWDYARVELATDPKDKVLALVQIGQLQYSRITKVDMVDAERLEIADSGIAALMSALELQPENANLHSLLATIYQFRALAHQQTWARTIDAASQRYHHLKRKELADKAKAAQAEKAASEGPASGEGAKKSKASKEGSGQTPADPSQDEGKE